MDNSGIIASTPPPSPHAGARAQHIAESYTFSDFSTIAETGYSRIVRARRHNQWWVLKCMKADFALQPFFQQMLQKEYDLLIRMHHSGIDRPISIEHVEELGPCLVMECIEGVTLGEFHTDRDGRRRIAFQIVETMAYVHSCQVVHRDLKPANIMVTHNGQYVKIIDFGLADADNYAILKQPAGTPRYIAPEQLTTGEPDVRNDVYSLGIILDELRLGWAFRHVVRRCTGPIERRYMGAGELLRAMRRAERLPALASIAASVTLLAIAIATLMLILLPTAPQENSESADASKDTADRAVQIIPRAPQADSLAGPTSPTPSEAPPASEANPVSEATPPTTPKAATGKSTATETTNTPTVTTTYAAAYKAATKRVDKYMSDHHYAQLLRTIQTEPAPSQPWTRDPRCKEICKQKDRLLNGLWDELAQIREDSRPQLPEEEVELLYTSLVNYSMHNYSQIIGKALLEYFDRKPSPDS